MREMRVLAVFLLLIPVSGCGYHAVGSAAHVPANVRSIAVPIFATKSQAYHTEVAFTQAVVRELNTRTKYRIEVQSAEVKNADAVLRGTIVSYATPPLTYDSTTGQTSSYILVITADVTLTARDGRLLYHNDAFAFKGQFQSTQDLNGFIQEDPSAVNRIARDFAQAMVSDMLESF